MKFGKSETGIFVAGATENNPTEQSLIILKFAKSQGFDCEIPSLDDMFDWSYDDHEQFGWLVEDAITYLNLECAEDDVYFTFRDTDFVLELMGDE